MAYTGVAGGECADELAGGCVPESGRAVFARRGEAAAVAAVSDAVDEIRMARHPPHLRATQPVEVIPLESSEVGLARRSAGLIQVAHDFGEIRILPLTHRQVDCRGISQVPGIVLALERLALALERLVLVRFCHAQSDLQIRAGGDGLPPLPEDASASECRREQKQADRDRGHGTAPDVLPDSFGGRGRPGVDRLAGKPAIKVQSEPAGRGIAFLGVFLQAFQADRLQVGMNLGIERSGTPRLLFDDLAQDLHRTVGLERSLTREQGVEDRAQAVDIGGGGDLVAQPLGLLGSHVAGRAHRRRGRDRRRLAIGFQPLGQSEVNHVGLVVVVHQDVRRLQVAVQHSALVGVVDRGGDLRDQPGDRERLPLEACQRFLEVLTGDQLHGVVQEARMFPGLKDGNDVGMVERRNRLGFAAQTGGFRGRWRRHRFSSVLSATIRLSLTWRALKTVPIPPCASISSST